MSMLITVFRLLALWLFAWVWQSIFDWPRTDLLLLVILVGGIWTGLSIAMAFLER
jgi:hypothetical protein